MAEYFKCDGFDGDGYPCSSRRVELIEGPTGPRGPRGAAGKSHTAVHLSARNTGGVKLDVSADGTPVPFPRFVVRSGFTPDAAFTSFAAEETGAYYLSYSVRTARKSFLKSVVVKNGAPLPETGCVFSEGERLFSAASIVALQKGDVFSLRLCEVNEALVLQEGAGASLVVIKLA